MSSAEKNNEKLFPLFRRNLTESNVNLYAATADKLATWASRDKAYYPYARPVIVELLETAHTQVHRHSGTPDKPFHISDYSESLKPWAEPFVRLLRTVAPFFCLFSEPDLQLRLRALLQTIDIDPLAAGIVEQPTPQMSPSAASFRPADTVPHSASPINQPPPSVSSGPSLFGNSRATPPRPRRAGSGTPAAALSLQHPMQASLSTGPALPSISASQHRLASPPVTIYSSLASMQQEQRHPPAPHTPGTPGMSSSVVHISGHTSGSAPPRVDPNQSATAGPSSVLSASPTLSIASSPAISTATPADTLKRKSKKRKKRLTEDDFIMADLADWESARASKATQPASPSLAGVERPASRAESTMSPQAEPQQAMFPVAGSSSGAPTLNGSSIKQASPAIAPKTESSKQSSPALAVSVPGPVDAAPAVAREMVSGPSAPGELETTLRTLAPVVAPGTETVQAAPPAERRPSTPTLSTAASPGLDLRQIASPGSPKTGRKKRSSHEFRFVSENRKSPTSLPVKRKKHSPSLVVFRLDPRSQTNGVQPGTPSANGRIPDIADVMSDVAQKREDPLPEPTQIDVVMNGEGEAKKESMSLNAPPTPEDASGTALGQGAHHESKPVPAAEELSIQESGSTTNHASDRWSEDVEMVDQLQDSEVDQTEPSPEPMDVDGDNEAETPVTGAADDPVMGVGAEPSAGQSEPGTDAFEQLRPSQAVGVATSEAPASAGLGHTQQGAVVKAHTLTGDIGVPADAQLPTDTSPTTMTSASTKPPLPATFEGVMQELAEQKGVSDTIMSRIVDAVSEEPKAVFKLAPAEWPTETRSSSPSEVSENADSGVPLEPVVPQKRSRSQSLAADSADEESSQQQRAKSVSPAPAPQALAHEPVSTLLPSEPTSISDAPHSPGAPVLESAMADAQPTPESAPTEDHTVSVEDAFAQEAPSPESRHEPEAESHGEAPVSMAVDTTEGQASTAETTPALEPEQAMEPHPRTADDARVEVSQDAGEDHEQGELDDDDMEPPVTLSTIPQSADEPVEEGEIQTPVATTLTSAPLVDPNGPLAYSDLRVLECRRGSVEDELVFDFTVDAELLASLSRWAGRYKSTEDVSQDHCLSFSCYPFNDCVDYIRARSHDSGQISSYEKLCRSVAMKWPKDGRLWAELVNANGAHKVTMSPPYLRNTEQVLDLSGHVALGKNALHVYQLRDHADFVFTLNIHTPVPSQLRELQDRREHDASWKAFLRSLSTFEFPEFPWSKKVAMVQTGLTLK